MAKLRETIPLNAYLSKRRRAWFERAINTDHLRQFEHIYCGIAGKHKHKLVLVFLTAAVYWASIP
jgi:hypothetical protein